MPTILRDVTLFPSPSALNTLSATLYHDDFFERQVCARGMREGQREGEGKGKVVANGESTSVVRFKARKGVCECVSTKASARMLLLLRKHQTGHIFLFAMTTVLLLLLLQHQTGPAHLFPFIFPPR